MNTCKTCKYWERWTQVCTDSDYCAGSCNFLGKDMSERGLGNNIRVYSDSVPITTEENFGCVHHEKL